MMRFFPSTFRPATTLALRAALVLGVASLFGACDRHSAEEVPESYGHGSSHERKVPNHQADSTGRDHFSDSVGLQEKAREEELHNPTPAPSVTGKGF